MIRLSGIDSAAIKVARQLFKNKKRITHAQAAADDDGVADVGDRGPDQQTLVVDRLDLDAGRCRLLAASASTRSSSLDTARALPPSRRKRSGPRRLCRWSGSPSSGLRVRWSPDPCREPDRLTVLLGDDDVLEIERVGRLRIGQAPGIAALRGRAAHGLEPVFSAQTVGHVGDRQVGRGQRLGIELDQRSRGCRRLEQSRRRRRGCG